MLCPSGLETRASDKRILSNYINGQSTPAADGQTSDLANPTTGEVFGTAPVSSAVDVTPAVP